MKTCHLLALGLALLAPSVVAGCAADEMEGEGAQYPKAPIGTDSVEQLASPPLEQAQAPGEGPTPISTVPVASAPPPPPPPQEIVPGSTTEEEYEARAGDVNVGADPNEYTDTDPSALTDFRQTLDPYGSWVDDPNYGTVWTPSPSVVGDDFAPYVSAGQWTYDDAQNWVWVSDYDWGWAPFHYGRWAYLGSRWGWIPGREYAGAWVTWRTGYGGWDDYLGWAPLPPSWGWRGGTAFGFGFTPQAPFVFCGSHDVFNPGIGGHLVPPGQVATVGAHTRAYAAPSVGGPGGRVAAHPTVGPPPSSVGIPPNRIAHIPQNDRGILHARQFARPATAQSFGAHAAMVSPRAYAQVAPRSTGITAYGRNEPLVRAPQYRGIAPTPYRFPSRSLGPLPNYGSYGGAPHYGPTYSAGRYASPSAGGGYYGGGGFGGFHPGGGGTVHASKPGSSSSSYEDPGVPAHRSSGGGFRGGFRGGGGFRGSVGGGARGGGGHR